MKGRRKGRPTKWVLARVEQSIGIGKPGVKFEVWGKWRKKDGKVGTLIVSVGGLALEAAQWQDFAPKSWDEVDQWFDDAP